MGIPPLAVIPSQNGGCCRRGRDGRDGGPSPWMVDDGPESENDGNCVIMGDRRLCYPCSGPTASFFRTISVVLVVS